MTDITANYLLDLGQILGERLNEVKGYVDSADESQRQFELGRYRAYREVVALMLSQADAFELSPGQLSLQGVDRGRDLGC